MAVVLLAGCKNGGVRQRQETESHELLNVVAQDYTLETAYPASIHGNQDIRIIPRVEGYLTGVYVKEGERVREGQLLFRLDDASYRAAMESATQTPLPCAIVPANVVVPPPTFGVFTRSGRRESIVSVPVTRAVALDAV